MATQLFTRQLAAGAKADPEALFKEFTANLIPNSQVLRRTALTRIQRHRLRWAATGRIQDLRHM